MRVHLEGFLKVGPGEVQIRFLAQLMNEPAESGHIRLTRFLKLRPAATGWENLKVQRAIAEDEGKGQLLQHLALRRRPGQLQRDEGGVIH
jgi:hypothetical protein